MRTFKIAVLLALAASCSGSPPVGNDGGGGGAGTGAVDPARCTVTVSPASVVADGTSFTRVTVTVLDTGGGPVGNQAVGLQVTGAGNTVPTASTTNAQGVVVLSLRSTVAEVKTVQAVLDPGPSQSLLPPQPQVTFVAGPPSSRTTLEFLTATAPADGTTAARARLTVRDANDNLVPSVGVVFGASVSEASAAPANGTTDAQGRVETNVTSTRSGLVTLTGSTAGVSTSANFTFSAGTAVAGTSTLTAAPTFAVADGVSTISIVTAVRDLGGSPVPGIAVSLSATGSGNTLLGPGGVTAANGEFSSTLSSTVAESKTITVAVNNAAFTLNRQVSFIAGGVSSARSTLSASPSTIPIFGSTTVTLITRDSQGNLVGGVAAGFSSNGDGGFMPDAGVTDGGGQLQSLFTALSDGTHTLRASGAAGFTVTAALIVDASCLDSLMNGAETDVDCGGGTCGKCADTRACLAPTDCISDVCTSGFCQVPICTDTRQNGRETAVDCGGDGGCSACADLLGCGVDADCISQRCLSGTCQVPACPDGRRNGLETDQDCGGDGGCARCADTRGCSFDSDCVNIHCVGNACAAASCSDVRKNGVETDQDCGGDGGCGRCADTLGCGVDGDCLSVHCVGNSCAPPTCTDLRKNGSETDVDCGGPNTCNRCAVPRVCLVGSDCTSLRCSGGFCAPPICTDLILNGQETDVDCGGPACPDCADDKLCLAATDCLSGVCPAGICLAPSCSDLVSNGQETDVDCGGDGGCSRCADGKLCAAGSHCQSGVCSGNSCQAPTCIDLVENARETDVDCGGDGGCPRCADDDDCLVDVDCLNFVCLTDRCRAPSCTDVRQNGYETDVDCGGDGGCPRCLVLQQCVFDDDCLNPLCIGTRCRELKFDAGVYGPTGVWPLGIASADVNRDGRPDLLAPSYSNGNVSLFFNQGDGTFATPPPTAACGLGPMGITTGDFDRDGLVDVAVSSQLGGMVTVMKGNPDAGFGPPASFGISRDDVVAGDFNQDGNLDLIAVNSNLHHYPGHGDGGFGSGPAFSTTCSQFTKVMVGDVDGDLNLDFVASCNPNTGFPGSAVVVRGNGDGTFLAPVIYLAGLYSYGVALGDLNGDARPELFVANTNDNTMSMFINAGDGTYGPRINVPVGQFPDSVATGDFNADGFTDVAVSNADSTAHLFLGRGNGTLSPPLIASTNPNASSGTTDLIALDLNGDGKADLAMSNRWDNSVSVLLSQCR